MNRGLPAASKKEKVYGICIYAASNKWKPKEKK
jgi:hypothetical protein